MEDESHIYITLTVLYSVIVYFALPSSACGSFHELIQCVNF